MSTVTDPKQETPSRPKAADQLPSLRGPRLPYHPGLQERFGIDKTSWKALVEAIFPTATSMESVVLALSYCRARKLDPFKRCVHIVPIYNKDLKAYVDTIWPGIGELRTTAFRTGEYAGRDECVCGDDICQKIGSVEVTYPEWARVTVYRMVKGQRVAFMGPKVWWIETYAVKSFNDASPNQMWSDRPRGQLEKCAEAAALRASFPEEIGGDYIPEEVTHGKPMATEAIEHSGAAAGLDAIADRLEAERKTEVNPESTAEPPKSSALATEEADTAIEFEKYRADMARVDIIAATVNVYDRYFGADSTIPFTSEQDQEACRIRDARAAELRAMRTNKK